jgi:cell division transport system ATP-binding protein
MRLFEELNKLGTTLVIATHNRGLVERFDHPHLHLADGELRSESLRKRSTA